MERTTKKAPRIIVTRKMRKYRTTRKMCKFLFIMGRKEAQHG